MLLGDAILVPVTEVGSVACAIGWAATCAAYLSMGRAGALPGQSSLSAIETLAAGFGLFVAIAMLLMKVIPAIPGHFTVYEWLALGIWIVLGVMSHRRTNQDCPERMTSAFSAALLSARSAFKLFAVTIVDLRTFGKRDSMQANRVVRCGLVLLITFVTAWPLMAQSPAAFDLVITNGHIIDGTGSPWYSGDVGIRDGKSPPSAI